MYFPWPQRFLLGWWCIEYFSWARILGWCFLFVLGDLIGDGALQWFEKCFCWTFDNQLWIYFLFRSGVFHPGLWDRHPSLWIFVVISYIYLFCWLSTTSFAFFSAIFLKLLPIVLRIPFVQTRYSWVWRCLYLIVFFQILLLYPLVSQLGSWDTCAWTISCRKSFQLFCVCCKHWTTNGVPLIPCIDFMIYPTYSFYEFSCANKRQPKGASGLWIQLWGPWTCA